MPKTFEVENKVGVHITSRGPYIVTYTGKRFYPLDIRADDICIEDIAHALSLQCRFGGHVRRHYSVGQHSLHVAEELRRMEGAFELRGLLHDASEAYLVDVPRPIKQIADFSVYREIERTVQACVYVKYGLPAFNATADELVKEADNLLLAKEAEMLMDNPPWCRALPKSSQRLFALTPQEVERQFLKKFKELTHGNN